MQREKQSIFLKDRVNKPEKDLLSLSKNLKFNTSGFLVKSDEVIQKFNEKIKISNKAQNWKLELFAIMNNNLAKSGDLEN